MIASCRSAKSLLTREPISAPFGFTLVVIVFGFFDLKFLFKALREELVDETDDGRVDEPKLPHEE